MTVHSFTAKDTTKKESPLSEPSSKQTHTLSNYLTGQLPAIELPIYSAPRLFTLASTSTSDILKEYFGGERPSTPPQDASDPRIFSLTHSSALSSTHSLQTTDSVDVSSSQSQSVMTSVIQAQSRDQIRKELNQNYDFLITLRAAQKGSSEAQFSLGCAYYQGVGVKEDKSEAFVWFRKAAERGHADAQFQIGAMYANGKGVEANDIEAFNWHFKAAGNGSVDAQLELASHYQQGLGVKKDVLQATYWLLKSAVDATGREIFPNNIDVGEDFISDVIQCIPVALTTFPEFKYIKAINFKLFELSDEDFLSIGQMIRANPHLEGLNFQIQKINDAQALILLQSLAFNTALTKMIFDDEYDFDVSIFNEIKASLAQNVIIAELREHMKNHPITRSDELPLEVLDIIVDDMIVAASKGGKDVEGNRIEPTSKEATIAAIDEFLKRVSQQTLKNDLKKSS